MSPEDAPVNSNINRDGTNPNAILSRFSIIEALSETDMYGPPNRTSANASDTPCFS